MKLHLIDDDEKLHELLKLYFEDVQIEMTGSETPLKGIEYVKNNVVDLVILDLMLPEMDGFEVCKRLRVDKPDIPILMLTAKGDDLNKIIGLELGADDYLAKPFNPRELLARIKSILRRTERSKEPAKEDQILYSPLWDIKIDNAARTVKHKNELIEFTATEFDLLKCFIQNPGIVYSRESLMDKIKGIEFEAFDRSIDVHISKIRQKLGDNAKNPEIIKTVWGIGYIMPKL